MYKTIFEINEVPKELRDCFEEIEVQCGAPWARVVEKTRDTLRPKSRPVGAARGISPSEFRGVGGAQQSCQIVRSKTIGWRPTCECNAGDPVPAVVLDPFAGAGTTGVVALSLGRSFIGIELNADYAEMASKRIQATMPLFAENKG